MISFKEFLKISNKNYISEGGNVTITASSGESKEAERLDLTKKDRAKYSKIIFDSLLEINKKAKFWTDEVIKNKKMFSGSAFHFFDSSILDTEFKSFKPTVGDIDLQVDEKDASKVETFLKNNIDKTFGELTLIGYKKSAAQFISLWEIAIDKKPDHNIQMDFELVEFENNEPSEWSQFSHSSDINDLKAGIKGYHHKMLFRSLSWKNVKEINTMKVMKTKTKFDKLTTNLIAFSVDKGLRDKYKKVEVDGKTIYQEVEPKDSEYTKNITEILNKLFELESSNKFTSAELKQASSFVGTLTLIKKYTTKDEQKNIFNGYLNVMFGKGAQGLYKGTSGAELDQKEKMIGVNHFMKELKISLTDENKEMITEYYRSYK
jgi:hypothetical protein